MKTLIPTLLMASLALASAQDAPAPAPAAAKAKAKAETSAAQVKPSRYLITSHDEFLAAMKKRLAISAKKRGPFGLYQVPGTAPAISTVRKRTTQKATPFADIVRALSISAVFADEQEFMVGSQVFRQGQVFSLLAGEEKLKVKVAGVRADRVDLQNTKSGEIATKSLDLLPDGVTAGVGGAILPSGVQQSQEAQSVRVDLKVEDDDPSPRFRTRTR